MCSIITIREVLGFSQVSGLLGVPPRCEANASTFWSAWLHSSLRRLGCCRYRCVLSGDRVTYRRTQQKGGQKRRDDGNARESENKVKWGGQILDCFDRRAGIRNRCSTCDSEYRLAPKCSLRDIPKNAPVPSPRLRVRPIDLPSLPPERNRRFTYRIMGVP